MNTITHTINHRGESWTPSMGGVGEVHTEEVTRIRWNDANNTELTIVGTSSASVVHAGKRYQLKWICASRHEVLVDYWMPRIQKRLESTRLADRIGSGVRKEDIGGRVQAWNAELAAKRTP